MVPPENACWSVASDLLDLRGDYREMRLSLQDRKGANGEMTAGGLVGQWLP